MSDNVSRSSTLRPTPRPIVLDRASASGSGISGITPNDGGALTPLLRSDRDRYTVASSSPPSPSSGSGYVVGRQKGTMVPSPASAASSANDAIISRIAQVGMFVSSFDGTSQYSSGGPSACGLAAMNAVRQVLLYHQTGVRDVELLKAMHQQEFHKVSEIPSNSATTYVSFDNGFTIQEVISICSFLSETDHLEIDELQKLPIFARTMSFIGGEYQRCSFESFQSLLGLSSIPRINDRKRN